MSSELIISEVYIDLLERSICATLMTIMPDGGPHASVVWLLWAAIQANTSKIEFDFWGWATERWGRALEKLDSAEFHVWLKDVQTL